MTKLDNYVRFDGKRGKKDWYVWKVFINEDEKTLNKIDHVEYLLSPTFTHPKRIVFNRESNFALFFSALEPFKLRVRITFNDGKSEDMSYSLDSTKGWPLPVDYGELVSSDQVIDAKNRGWSMKGKNLMNINLEGVELSSMDMSKTNLYNAIFTNASLPNVNLVDANLTKAKLHRANLTRANLSGACLSDADLTNANLTDVDLSGANLTNANLSKATIIGAKTEEVTINDDTKTSDIEVVKEEDKGNNIIVIEALKKISENLRNKIFKDNRDLQNIWLGARKY